MDRLLCGDVGYGKTELAMRAAFKAVDAGYQVAVLVPTTILAEQHLRTFTARMAEFPFEIAVALAVRHAASSRPRSSSGWPTGSVDIVIGTHRLAQPDVQFHNLGLVIIDEEQRFGVEVKERLKALRQTVDVLTMTATPIPRTLHMGLLGLRDISNLETPPEDRLAVETRVDAVRRRDDPPRRAAGAEPRRADLLRPQPRRGHRDRRRRGCGQIVPEARLAIAHGQMAEHELEQVMLDFVDRRFDLLLATTIVESGLDIPNANTIFIDEADRYGLADLHQLRGRVGRYKHRAYCYLLIDPNKNLSPSAAKRLRAIEEFSDMGAGFAIAMRDLEIRGAGNILGTEQSGHIATVGYELYCDLLEQAVRRPEAAAAEDVDRGRRRSARRGLHSPRLRARHAAEDRPVSAAGARVRRGRNWTTSARSWSTASGRRRRWCSTCSGWPRLRIAAHGWQIDTIHLEDQYVVFALLVGPEDPASLPPKAGERCGSSTARAPICRWTATPPRPRRSAAESNRCCSRSDLATIIHTLLRRISLQPLSKDGFCAEAKLGGSDVDVCPGVDGDRSARRPFGRLWPGGQLWPDRQFGSRSQPSPGYGSAFPGRDGGYLPGPPNAPGESVRPATWPGGAPSPSGRPQANNSQQPPQVAPAAMYSAPFPVPPPDLCASSLVLGRVGSEYVLCADILTGLDQFLDRNGRKLRPGRVRAATPGQRRTSDGGDQQPRRPHQRSRSGRRPAAVPPECDQEPDEPPGRDEVDLQ